VIPAPPLRRAVPHLTIAGTVFVAFAVGFAVIQLVWLEELRRTRVILLGAGDRLSILVTAGDARLLLASGDDPTEFGNALGRVLRPSHDRIDMALVAGTGDDLRAAAIAAAHPDARSVGSVAPFPRSSDLPALVGVPFIGTPRRIYLGDATVTLEAAPANDEDGAVWAWRATIERGGSKILVLSDGEAANRFPAVAPASVLVVAGQDPMAGRAVDSAPVLALPDAAVPPARLREAATAGEPVPSTIVRVFPGEVVPLEFVDGGIALPGEWTASLAEPLGNPSVRTGDADSD
jgi:hypothetical protein